MKPNNNKLTLGAQAVAKEKDVQLRLQESQMRNDAMLKMSKQNQQNNAPKTNESNNGENN